MSRRYIVIGAGGVGAALAAGATAAGIPVILVSRGATLAAIRSQGLRFVHGARQQQLEPAVVGAPGEVVLREGDVLVLATKTQDAAVALQEWARQPVVGEDGAATDLGFAGDLLPLLVLQNGLEAERSALRYFRRVLSGTTLIAARHVVPGEVRVFTGPKLGQIILGVEAAPHPDAAQALAESVADELREAGWLSQVVVDPQRWKAWKLVVSSAFGVEVLSGTSEELERLREQVKEETRSVLEGAGIAVADPSVDLRFDRSQAAVGWDADYVPGQVSTWQSFTRGSGSEIDYLNGEVALLARRGGGTAPLNSALQRLLSVSAAAGEEPQSRSVQELLVLAAREQELAEVAS